MSTPRKTHLRNFDDFVSEPEAVAEKDRIVQVFQDERYNFYAIMRSGRVFRKRAKGQTGAYDLWQEIDVLSEIKEDLSL